MKCWLLGLFCTNGGYLDQGFHETKNEWMGKHAPNTGALIEWGSITWHSDWWSNVSSLDHGSSYQEDGEGSSTGVVLLYLLHKFHNWGHLCLEFFNNIQTEQTNRSAVLATPVKFEHGMKGITSVLIILEIINKGNCFSTHTHTPNPRSSH